MTQETNFELMLRSFDLHCRAMQILLDEIGSQPLAKWQEVRLPLFRDTIGTLRQHALSSLEDATTVKILEEKKDDTSEI